MIMINNRVWYRSIETEEIDNLIITREQLCFIPLNYITKLGNNNGSYIEDNINNDAQNYSYIYISDDGNEFGILTISYYCRQSKWEIFSLLNSYNTNSWIR